MRSVLGGLLLAATTVGCSFLLDFDELKGNGADETSDSDASEPASDTEDDATDPSEPSATESDTESDVTDSDPEGTELTEDLPDASSPSTGDAGDAGCPDDCDDGDPCTIDQCTPEGCERQPIVCTTQTACHAAICINGECVETPKAGFELDGYDETVAVDEIHRSDLVSAGDRFYRATYGVWDGVPDVRVVAFDRTDAAPIAEFRVSQVLGGLVVMSPASMVTDTRLGLTLSLYLAVRPPGAADLAGSIARVRVNRNLELLDDQINLVSTAANYRPTAPHLGPSAAQPPNGDPFVVWNGCTTTPGADGPVCVSTEVAGGQGGVFIQIGDEGLDPNNPGSRFIPEPREVSGLVAITAGQTPGAMWMSNLQPRGIRVNTGFVSGDPPTQFVQCHGDGQATGYTLDAARSLGNIWTTSWSLRSANTFLTEFTVMHCRDGACVDLGLPPPITECPTDAREGRVADGTRSLVVRALTRPGDPAGRLYHTTASVTSLDDDTSTLLSLHRVDLDPAEGVTAEDSSVTLAALPLAETADGVELPALATLAPDKLAVSWLEPKASATSQDVLRVQRYRICFGE